MRKKHKHKVECGDLPPSMQMRSKAMSAPLSTRTESVSTLSILKPDTMSDKYISDTMGTGHFQSTRMATRTALPSGVNI